MLSRMKEDLPRTLLRASWGAIALGLLLEKLLFPVGCACVLWTTAALTRRAA